MKSCPSVWPKTIQIKIVIAAQIVNCLARDVDPVSTTLIGTFISTLRGIFYFGGVSQHRKYPVLTPAEACSALPWVRKFASP
jgi:hypothetical protein